jgi:pimeloyl-ACP methyl ester carboxylesterase
VDNQLFDIRRIGSMGEGGLSCRRLEFHHKRAPNRQIICFLPWLFSYARSFEAGIIPPGCLFVYEMPHAIVSASPGKSVEALHVVVQDFLALMQQRQFDPAALTLVGLSIGNFVATYLANRIGARLWSVASGDRGEVLVWNSILAEGIRKQAEANGVHYPDFEKTLNAFNPINNLDNLGDGSTFIAGRFDKIVPYRCARNVALAARSLNRTTRRIVLPLGHSGTLFAGVQYLRFMMRARNAQETTPERMKKAGAEAGPLSG